MVTVDGTYSERWITAGSFTLLASSTVFVGGSEATYNLPGNNNWVGCLKKVRPSTSLQRWQKKNVHFVK